MARRGRLSRCCLFVGFLWFCPLCQGWRNLLRDPVLPDDRPLCPPAHSDGVAIRVIDLLLCRRRLSGNSQKQIVVWAQRSLTSTQSTHAPHESEDKSGFLIRRKSVGTEVKIARRHDSARRKASPLLALERSGSPRPRARKAEAFGKTISATEKWRTAGQRY